MAIDFDTFVDRLNKLPNEMNDEIQRSTLSIARGVKSLIQRRIQETGISSSGSPLASYSEKGVPAFLLEGKSLNASGEQAVQDAGDRGELVSYKQFRDFQGLQTGHTDLTFTGEMWRQIDFKQRGSGSQFITTIGPTTDEAENKLEWNSERYGPILKPSPLEIEQAVTILENKIADLFNKAFE